MNFLSKLNRVKRIVVPLHIIIVNGFTEYRQTMILFYQDLTWISQIHTSYYKILC